LWRQYEEQADQKQRGKASVLAEADRILAAERVESGGILPDKFSADQEFWLLEEETVQINRRAPKLFPAGFIESSANPRTLIPATDHTGEEIHD